MLRTDKDTGMEEGSAASGPTPGPTDHAAQVSQRILQHCRSTIGILQYCRSAIGAASCVVVLHLTVPMCGIALLQADDGALVRRLAEALLPVLGRTDADAVVDACLATTLAWTETCSSWKKS